MQKEKGSNLAKQTDRDVTGTGMTFRNINIKQQKYSKQKMIE